MKTFTTTYAAVLTSLVFSILSSSAQSLNLSTGTLITSLTNQELVAVLPPIPPGTLANFGSVSTWVVNDSAYDTSGYMFIYQIVNTSPDTMENVAFDGFSGGVVTGTGVYSNLVGSLSLPYSFAPADPSGSFTFQDVSPGGAATFQTSGFPTGGTASFFLVVDTDENSYTPNFATTDDDFDSTGNILSPLATFPVPEPSFAWMTLAGFVCLGSLQGARRMMKSGRQKTS